jgi:hypothetical protein
MRPIYFAVISVGLLGVAVWSGCVALDRFELSGRNKPKLGRYDALSIACFAAAMCCMAKFGGLL